MYRHTASVWEQLIEELKIIGTRRKGLPNPIKFLGFHGPAEEDSQSRMDVVECGHGLRYTMHFCPPCSVIPYPLEIEEEMMP